MTINPFIFTSAISLMMLSNVSFAACNSESFEECLNGVGPAVTSSDSLRTTADRISSSTSQREDNSGQLALADTLSGRAAGDALSNWSIWSSYSNNNFNGDPALRDAFDELNNPVPLASYDADVDSILIGMDTLINDQLVLGVTVGYEDADIATRYNGGNNTSDGFTVIPYLAYLIDQTFSIDLATGYSSLSYDTDRIDPTNGSTILGSFDSDRWFVTTNLNAARGFGKWFVSSRVGLVYSEEQQDGYTETGGPKAKVLGERNIDLTQLILGVDIAYSMGDFEPYIIATYLNDLNRHDGFDAGGLPNGVAFSIDDDDEIQSGIGLRYFGDGVSGTLEWSKTFGRSAFDGDVIMATLRADI